jgi:hypothetical protein
MKSSIKGISAFSFCLLLVIILPTLVLADGPPNDNFANATEISGRSGTVSGSNVGAGWGPDEPFHADVGNRYSVWWKWTSPVNGIATFSTAGTSFDPTILAVYQDTEITSSLVLP